VDVNRQSLNVCVKDMARKISSKTKAIVCMHYGGDPCDMDAIHNLAQEYGIPVIEDAAHALGAEYNGKPIGSISQYTMFSFQAIKHMTTGDGGMLIVPEEQAERAKRLRWFGIDRSKKQAGIWDNDITEAGYKYQMTDIQAAMGLAGLEEFDEVLRYRQDLFWKYHALIDLPSAFTLSSKNESACWLLTMFVKDRKAIEAKLKEKGIECGQNHYRNDRYSIFGGPVKPGEYPNMDAVEDDYLVIPLHTKMTLDDVRYVCEAIVEARGWASCD